MPAGPIDELPDATPAFEPTPRNSASTLSRFLELKLHAQGGLGEVYEAWNAEFHRTVALKFLKAEHSTDGESRERFRGEAEVTGRLEHPGIVPIYGLGEDDAGQPCYAMRFVRGLPMDEAIRSLHDADGEPDPARRDERLADLLARIKGTRRDPAASDDLRERAFRELLGRFKAVCETVAYAHSKGVLHRDIKPANVMLGRFGETLVVDWGLARTFDPTAKAGAGAGGDDAESTIPVDSVTGHLTPTVGPKGTPSYMSPEQSMARRDLGPASDVYSLGATLYSLLTGRSPFHGRRDDVLEQVRDGAFPPPRSVRPAVPKPLEAICVKAMARDPGRRYAQAEELADDIDNWLNDRPVAAWREPWTVRLGRWTKRHRTSVAATIVGLAVLGAVAWRIRAERLRVEADALASLEVAERLSADSLRDLAKWAAASSAAERAKGLLDSAGLGGEVRRRTEAALALLRSQERDRKTVHDLEEARLAGAVVKEGHFDREARTEGLRRVLRDYGIDPEARPTEELAGLVRASAIRDDLLAEIDEAAYLAKPGPARDGLLALARAADDDPDRGEIRDAIARKDGAMLVRLARAIDSRAAGAGRSFQLATALNSLGEFEDARDLLERARAIHPDDFWINHELAWAYAGLRPPQLEQAVRYYSVALALRPRSPAVYNNLGIALRGRGDLAGAEASYRRAVALKPDYAEAHCNLGHALSALGKFSEALASLRRGHELGSKRPGWRYPSASWVRECERLVALEPRLPGILSGDDRPTDEGEAIAFAYLGLKTKKYGASAWLYEAALASFPRLAADPATGHRYNAACAAALAGAGKGQDVPPLDDAARARWRTQALAWLRANLDAWGKQAEGPSMDRELVKTTLAHWKADADLTGIRDPEALAKLPEAEREECRTLWADVDALLKRAGEPPAK
jgi:serine/threonine protein kinase